MVTKKSIITITFILLVSFAVAAFVYLREGSTFFPRQNDDKESSFIATSTSPTAAEKASATSFEKLKALANETIRAEKDDADPFSKTLALLSYIQKNNDEVKRYLFKQEGDINSSGATDVYKTILSTYALYQVQDTFSDGIKAYTDSGRKPLSLSASHLDTGKYLFTVDELYDSGAYNMNSQLYLVLVTKDRDITVTDIPQIGFKEGVPILEQNTENVRYDEKINRLIVLGFKPFGMYPCNEISYYAFASDRFIYDYGELPAECLKHKKDYYDEPKVVTEAFESNVDFSQKVVMRKTSAMDFEKAKSFQIKDASPSSE